MKVVRALTGLDLAICASLALPGLSDLTLAVLDQAGRALGLGGLEAPLGAGAFFVNLAGGFGVLWNIAMLRVREPALHQVDLVARLGVIGLIVYHVAASQLSGILFAFVVTECVGGFFKWRWLQRGPAA